MDLESIEFRLVKRKGGGMLGIVVGGGDWWEKASR